MNNTTRYIFAGVLIFLIILLQPIYLKWLGYGAVGLEDPDPALPISVPVEEEKHLVPPVFEDNTVVNAHTNESFITISTPLYTATLTNKSGGSFINYTLKEENSGKLKYLGGYDEGGVFRENLPVSIIMPSQESCMPCLAYYDDRNDKYHFAGHSCCGGPN